MDEFSIDCEDEIKSSLKVFLSSINSQMSDQSDIFYQQTRLAVSQTPTSFLSFIELYKQIYQRKIDEMNLKET